MRQPAPAALLIPVAAALAVSLPLFSMLPRSASNNVPISIETRLNDLFDHNVDAIQRGCEKGGYAFYRAFVPWEIKSTEKSGDSESATPAHRYSPGAILFRKRTDPSALLIVY